MSRKQPENPYPPEVPEWSNTEQKRKVGGTEVIVQTRSYKLITPLFGGGVEACVNDPITLIRGTEIRGQLRFWWRAIRGWQYESLEEMKRAEDEIWGAASNTKKQKKESQEDNKKQRWKEAVQIVINENWLEQTEQAKIDLPVYAAFPLTDQEGSMQTKEITAPREGVSLGVHFELLLSYSALGRAGIDIALEVEAAVWAWETFGGVGARTRRGFGAIQLEAINGVPYTQLPMHNSIAARKWLDERFTKYGGNESYPEDVPHIVLDAAHFLVLEPAGNVLFTWNELIDKLQKFRRKPPRTYLERGWPESKAIKELAAAENESPEKDYARSFPRSALGLPINFYFGEESQLGKISLEGVEVDKEGIETGKERLASPLILRPLACQEQKTLGLALLLKGSRVPLEGLALMRRSDDSLEKKSLNHKPIKPKEQEKALLECMEYIRKKYGKEPPPKSPREQRSRNNDGRNNKRNNPYNRGKRR